MEPCPVARSDTELHPVPLAAGVILAKRAEPEGHAAGLINERIRP